MPKYWYDYKACNDDPFLQSICVEKKPYFMTYIYGDYKKKYRDYVDQTQKDARRERRKELRDYADSEDEKKFLEYYNAKFPFGMGRCSMNRICWFIEDSFKGLQTKLKKSGKFNYKFLKKGVGQDEEHVQALQKLCFEYVGVLRQIKKNDRPLDRDLKETNINNRNQLKRYFRTEAEAACPDADERADIILDLVYKHGYNHQFLWDCAGKEIVQRLEKQVYGDI